MRWNCSRSATETFVAEICAKDNCIKGVWFLFSAPQYPLGLHCVCVSLHDENFKINSIWLRLLSHSKNKYKIFLTRNRRGCNIYTFLGGRYFPFFLSCDFSLLKFVSLLLLRDVGWKDNLFNGLC